MQPSRALRSIWAEFDWTLKKTILFPVQVDICVMIGS